MRMLIPLLLSALVAGLSTARAIPSDEPATASSDAVSQPEEAGGLRIPLSDWRLANGLRVIYSPHRRVPAVTVQVWYHVGSKDERPGIRGVAHMFEHMMFKGSKHVPTERHAQMLAALGGSVNAFTTQDLTAYHNTLPRQYLEFAIELEAERMGHLLLRTATVDSEREVVKEEKRLRLENSPIGRSHEAIHALAYREHPYAWTPAGDIPDLDRVTLRLCQQFYDTYYVPSNATLVVVGDVEEAEVRRAVAEHFGAIPRGKAPPRVGVIEPPQRETRSLTADWRSQLNVALGSYHIPSAQHADRPALVVLATILSDGRSSRLHQALVRKGKAALGAGAFIPETEHPGLFFSYAYGLPSHELPRMKALLLQEIARIAKEGVRDKELTKARNQLTTRYLERLQTVYGLAQQIGSSTYLKGDPRAFIGEIGAIARVTKADVKRTALKHLREENLSLVLLPAAITPRPRGRSGGPPRPSTSNTAGDAS